MRLLMCLVLVVGCAGSRQMATSIDASSKGGFWGNEQVIPKLANHPDEPPFLNGWPEHLARTGDRTAFPDRDGILIRNSGFGVRPKELLDTIEFTPYLPQLRVFEIKKYRAIFHGDERAEFDKRLSDLKAAIHGCLTRFPQILPAVEAYPAFHANVAAVCFDGGKGVRAVTMYVQDNNLIENGRLFYTLQGLSDDQHYWIAAYWPVEVEGLRAQSNDLNAQETVILNSPELYAEYLREELEFLENAMYAPTLEQIDELVGGLRLEE